MVRPVEHFDAFENVYVSRARGVSALLKLILKRR